MPAEGHIRNIIQTTNSASPKLCTLQFYHTQLGALFNVLFVYTGYLTLALVSTFNCK